MIAGLRRLRRVDLVVVVHKVGMELVGLAGEEAVEALEAAAERPPVAGRAHRHVRCRREVPLPDRERGVAVAHQYLGEEAVLVRDGRVVPGVARGELDDAGHAVGVVVAPGEQARSRRRAQSSGVEARVAQTVAGQTVERRGVDVGAVAPELRVADVVEQHHHNVRRAVGCADRLGPPWRRLLERAADDSLELRHCASPSTRTVGFSRAILDRPDSAMSTFSSGTTRPSTHADLTPWDAVGRIATTLDTTAVSRVVRKALCVRSRRLQALDQVHTVEVWGSRPQSPTTKGQVRPSQCCG